MTRIIQFVGGPGSGKSTLAHELYAWMKKKNLDVAFIKEFPTELCETDRKHELDDQFYLFGEQHHRIYSLLNNVDYIVTDTSLALMMHYITGSLKKYGNNDDADDIKWSFRAMVMYLYNLHDNVTFFVERTFRHFSPKGRAHTEEQAIKLDEATKEILDLHSFSYYTVSDLDGCIKDLKFDDILASDQILARTE